ncbi:hypothetical protein ABW20_dc0110007 [Dactylellina cionopaga]|nr:hypothetical protein ABW20_dc0110007 [Dactylellina cionopaga]
MSGQPSPLRPRSPFRFDQRPRPRSPSPEAVITSLITSPRRPVTPPDGEFDIHNPAHVSIRRERTLRDSRFDHLWERDMRGFGATVPASGRVASSENDITVPLGYENRNSSRHGAGEGDNYRYPTPAAIRENFLRLTRQSSEGRGWQPQPQPQREQQPQQSQNEPQQQQGIPSSNIEQFLEKFISATPDEPPEHSLNTLGYTLVPVTPEIRQRFTRMAAKSHRLRGAGLVIEATVVLKQAVGGYYIGLGNDNGWWRVPFSRDAKRKNCGSDEYGVESLGIDKARVEGRIRWLGEHWEVVRKRGGLKMQEMEDEENARVKREKERRERRERLKEALKTRGAGV